MGKIKNTQIENLLLCIAGVSFPLVNLRMYLPFYSISLYMLSLFFIFICVFLRENICYGKFIVANFKREEVMVIIFMILLLSSLLYSSNQHLGIIKFIKLFVSILFYMALTHVFTKNPSYIMKIMHWATRGYPIYILYLSSYYFVKFKVNYLGINTRRATGAGKNSLAFMACIVIAFSLTFLLDKKLKIRDKIIEVFLNLITVISIFLIQSRGLFLVFLAQLFIYFSITSNKIKKILILLMFGAGLLAFASFFIPESCIDNSIHRFSGLGVIFTKGESISTLSEERFSLIKKSIDLFVKSPCLGKGLGSFVGNEEGNLISHNDYLLVLSEQGFVGFLTFVFLIFSFVKLAYVNYKREKILTNKSLLIAVVSIVIYFLFINAYDNILVWTIFAMISSTSKRLALKRKNIRKLELYSRKMSSKI